MKAIIFLMGLAMLAGCAEDEMKGCPVSSAHVAGMYEVTGVITETETYAGETSTMDYEFGEENPYAFGISQAGPVVYAHGCVGFLSKSNIVACSTDGYGNSSAGRLKYHFDGYLEFYDDSVKVNGTLSLDYYVGGTPWLQYVQEIDLEGPAVEFPAEE
jgi:hypothetical protein